MDRSQCEAEAERELPPRLVRQRVAASIAHQEPDEMLGPEVDENLGPRVRHADRCMRGKGYRHP